VYSTRRGIYFLTSRIIVNNAGYVVGVDKVGDLSMDNMEGMFATNVFGLIALTQLFVKGEHLNPCLQLSLSFVEFKKRKAGHIINLGSIAGVEAYAGGSIYCATKHAVNAFTTSLMKELVDTPIRVTEIQPGKRFYHRSRTKLMLVTRYGRD
jgi:3-hydroxy acid dehydrogenase/malonic semialdehyde reductase